MIKKIPIEEYRSIFSKVPRICVDLVVKTDKGIILTKRDIEPFKGRWHTPGGGILFGETLEQAVKRVAKEELDLEVEIVKNLGVMEFTSELKFNSHSISIVFLVKIKSGNIKLDHQASEVMISNSIPENTIPEQREFLNKILNSI